MRAFNRKMFQEKGKDVFIVLHVNHLDEPCGAYDEALRQSRHRLGNPAEKNNNLPLCMGRRNRKPKSAQEVYLQARS